MSVLSKVLVLTLALANLTNFAAPAFADDGCQLLIMKEQHDLQKEEKLLVDLRAKLEGAKAKDGVVYARGFTTTLLGGLTAIGAPVGAIVYNFLKDASNEKTNQGKNVKKGLVIGAVGLVVSGYGIYTLMMKPETAKELKAAVEAKQVVLEQMNKQLDEDLRVCQQQK